MTHVIAHRGASATHPENTVAAFREARRVGASMVELDVRRTADARLAVHHDAILPRGIPLNRVSSGDLPPSVPLLGEALEACAGMAVNVEIKEGEAAGAVVELVRERGLHDSILVSSFDLTTVDAVRAADDRIATAWLTGAGDDQLAAIRTCVEHGHGALHPEDSALTEDVVAAAADAGVAVNVWTVDDPDRMRTLIAWGVDGICTNVPHVLVDILTGTPT